MSASKKTAHKACAKRRAGFTMVEMLITISIFSLLAAALLMGLRSGAGAYETARAKHARTGTLEAALRVFTADLRQTGRMSKAFAPLVEEREDEHERLLITTFEQTLRQRAGQGAVWNHVSYELQEDSLSGGTNLVRTAQGYVADAAAIDEEEKQVLLRDVDSLAFHYLAGGKRMDDWQDAEHLPQAVELHLRTTGLPPISKVAWIGAAQLDPP